MLTSSRNRGAAALVSDVVPSPTRSATSEEAVNDGTAVDVVACTVNEMAVALVAVVADALS
jgi:hypothetical protein